MEDLEIVVGRQNDEKVRRNEMAEW